MTLYLGTTPLIGAYIGSAPLAQAYLGGTLVFGGGAPSSPKVAALGDSTTAEYPTGIGITPVPNLIASITPTLIAVPGETINQQLGHWSAVADPTIFDAVTLGGPGLNDITGSGTAAAAIGRLQALVTAIRNAARPNCKIIIAQMVPCAQRWYDLFGPSGGPVGYQQWLDINAAIAGNGSSPITGVDARVTSHVVALAVTLDISGGPNGAYSVTGQANCLNPSYEAATPPDHIHENNTARQIIANAYRTAMVSLGLLTA